MFNRNNIMAGEVDSSGGRDNSFAYSLIFHLLIGGVLLFFPGLLIGKKEFYQSAYKVTLIELPQKTKPFAGVSEPVIPAKSETTAKVKSPVKLSKLHKSEHQKMKVPLIKEKVMSNKPAGSMPEPAKTEKPSIKEKIKEAGVSVPVQNKIEKAAETPVLPPAPAVLVSTQTPPLQKKEELVLNDKEGNGGEELALVLSPRGNISLDAAEFPYEWYLNGIKSKIEGKWSTFDAALLSGEIKRVVIKFKILRNGKIENTEIELSSGFSFFDNSALRAVLSSNPLPPLPMDFKEESLEIHFGFEYEKTG